MFLEVSAILHSNEMLQPVKALSPVIITVGILALYKSSIPSFVYGFNLFSKTSNPLNYK